MRKLFAAASLVMVIIRDEPDERRMRALDREHAEPMGGHALPCEARASVAERVCDNARAALTLASGE